MNEVGKSLKKNSVFYLIYNILNAVFPFITGMYVTRVLMPDKIGIVESARNLVEYFVIFSFLGIPTYGLREISKNRNDKEKINKIYSELMIINGISTIIFCIIYFILISSIPTCKNNLSLYLIAGILLFMNLFNNSWLYEGLEEFKYILIRNLVFKIISFVILVLIVRNSDSYLEYTFVTVIGTVGNYLLNILSAKKYVKFTLKDLNLKQHMKSIFYLVVVNLAIEIYSLVDITMLSIMKNPDTVAYYSYGVKIYKILLQIVNTFTMVLVPRISLYYKKNQFDLFNSLLTKTLNLILLLTIPMVIGINFVSPYLMTLIYGSSYIKSAYVLNILSFILIISPIGYLLGSRVLLVSNNEKRMVIPVAIGAVLNIIGNYFLISNYSLIGAAIASVLSEFAVMIIYIFLGKKYFKIEKYLKKSIFKIILSSFFMIIYLFLISKLNINQLFKLFIQVFGSSIIYIVTLIVLKEKFLCDLFKNKIRIRRAV